MCVSEQIKIPDSPGFEVRVQEKHVICMQMQIKSNKKSPAIHNNEINHTETTNYMKNNTIITGTQTKVHNPVPLTTLTAA